MSSAYNPSGQSAFSVELILNAQGNAQSYSRVVANDYTDGGDNKGFEVNLNGTTSLQVQFAIGNGTTFGFAGSFNTVPVTGTHVVTCTWDGTTLRIYIDGVLDPYTGSVSGTLAAGSYDVMIGADPGLGPGNYYVGELAQVSLYGTALSQADITAHYLAATAPAGHWIAPFSDANDFPFKGPLAFLRGQSKSWSVANPTIPSYNQSLSGALSFTGAKKNAAAYPLSGSLSFTGSVKRAVAHALAGTLSFAGTVRRAVVCALAGTLSFVGSQIRAISRPLSGALSFTGVLSRSITYLLKGTLSFVGAAKQAIGAKLTGVLSFSGAVKRGVGKKLAGVLSFVGSVASGMGIALVQSAGSTSWGPSPAAVAFSANTTAGNLLVAQIVTFSNDYVSGVTGAGGSWTLASRELLSTGGTASCEIWYAADIGGGSETVTVTVPGGSSYVAVAISEWSGAATSSVLDQATGNTNVNGGGSAYAPVTPSITPTVTGELLIAAAVTQQAMTSGGGYTNGFAESAGMADIYAVTPYPHYTDGVYLVDPADSAISAGFLKSPSGYYSTVIAAFLPAGGTISKMIAATLSFTGSVKRGVGYRLLGTLGFLGTTKRAVTHALAGALSFTSSQSHAVAYRLSGALLFVGTGKRAIATVLSGTLSFVGSASRAISRPLSGALSFTGTVKRAVATKFSGTLSFVGSKSYTIGRLLSGTLSFTGISKRAVSTKLSGVLAFSGITKRSIAAKLSGTLTFAGSLTAAEAFHKLISATLSFTGIVTSGISVRLSGALSFVSSLTRRLPSYIPGYFSGRAKSTQITSVPTIVQSDAVSDEYLTGIVRSTQAEE
jgi:hypothetical protein